MTKRKRERGIYEKIPGSGVWWIRFAVAPGKLKREKAGTLAHAKKLYQSRKADVWTGRKLPHTLRRVALTFAQMAAKALERSASKTPASHRDNVERLAPFIARFGNRPADAITSEEIETYLLEVKKLRKLAPSTANKYRSAVSMAYKRGSKIRPNPVRDTELLAEPASVIRWLTEDEEIRLKNAIEPKHPERWAQVLFSLNTGARASEQHRLTWQHVNDGFVTFPKTKNGDVRHVPINDYARAALDTVKGNDPVFVFPRQQHRVWFERGLSAAKITGYSWHTNRHSFCSRLAMAGVPLFTIAQIAGHRDIKVTMRYAHLSPGHNLDAVQMLVSKPTPKMTPATVA